MADVRHTPGKRLDYVTSDELEPGILSRFTGGPTLTPGQEAIIAKFQTFGKVAQSHLRSRVMPQNGDKLYMNDMVGANELSLRDMDKVGGNQR